MRRVVRGASRPRGRPGEGGRRGPERAHSVVRERGPESANAPMGVHVAGVDGGEGGIRTRDGLPRTAFPVRRHSPLGDLSLGTEYRQPQLGNRQSPTEVQGGAPRRHWPEVRGPDWANARIGVHVACVAGGEGGIRTRGAFAHRFSRAAPSTTRTPLRGRGYQTSLFRPAGASVASGPRRWRRPRTIPRLRRAGCH